MRKLIAILAAMVCVQLYTYFSMRNPPEAAPVVAAPAPVQSPRLYYHSPLEAPAMSVTAYTGMGYFSPESSSGFDPSRAHLTPVSSSQLVSANGLNWGDESERADIQRLQSVYKLPRTGLTGTLAGRIPASAYTSD